jgi:type I restriction enzyme, S subunit
VSTETVTGNTGPNWEKAEEAGWALSTLKSPPDWKQTQLRAFLARRKKINNNGLPLLSVNLPKGVVKRKTKDNLPAPSIDMGNYQEVRLNDFVMNQLGKPHGALGVSNHHGIISPAYFVAEVSPSAHPRFVHFLLRSRLYISEYEHRGKNQPPSQFDLSWEQFRSIPVALPKLQDQQQIADFLDRETNRIDAIIDARLRMIELLSERRQAVITETVTGNTGGGKTQLPRLKNLADVNVSNVDKKTVDGESVIRLINYTDVYYGDRLGPTKSLMSASATSIQIDKYRLHEGDVVITKDSETPDDIGIPAYIERTASDMVCGYHLAVIRPNPKLLIGRYLYYSMSSSHVFSVWEVEARGVTRFGLRTESIKNLQMDVLSLSEQQEIADFLDRETNRIDTIIGKCRESVELLRERRQALITAAVTGELEVAA